MTKSKPGNYLAYLLRLRRDNESTAWRATVENPHTGERQGFASLRQLIAFLEEQTGEILSYQEENDDKP
ncbi:MAG: hypothetical protein JW953_11535 [Anaerolineae bacterium]|nr:hypothetical protein [Anaerolineae bacterium]